MRILYMRFVECCTSLREQLSREDGPSGAFRTTTLVAHQQTTVVVPVNILVGAYSDTRAMTTYGCCRFSSYIYVFPFVADMISGGL